MSDELREVGLGFNRKVKSFTVYDVNGYRFRTRSYEESRPQQKTTCSGVRTPGNDTKDYYGIVEEIYELQFKGGSSLKPVVFKCHWFDPDVTREDLNIGLTEIRQDSKYNGDDVYIVANRDATQVYYLPWACQKDPRLAGWSLVHMVSPRSKAPVPNDEDYNFDPTTDEFYQPEGLEGSFEIDISALMSMEEDNDIDEDEGDDVLDAKDLQLLERWQRKRDGVVLDDDDDDGDGDDEDDRELDNIDSDDEESGDDVAPVVLPYAEIMSPPRNTIFLLLSPCNYVSLFTTTCHLFILTVLIFVIAGTRQHARRKAETELPLALRRSRRRPPGGAGRGGAGR